MADIMAEPVSETLPLLPSEASFLSATPPTDASSNVASSSGSTPPTSASPDNISLASEQGIAKLVAATIPVLQEPEALLPSLTPQDDYQQPEHEPELVPEPEQLPERPQEKQPEQPSEHHPEHQSEPRPEQQPEPLAENRLTDGALQLSHDLEAQGQPEPELDDGQQTPAASAIVVVPKLEPASESPSTTPGRPRRARASLPVYNISKLAGTDVHGKRRAKGDDVSKRSIRRASAADALIGNTAASTSTVNIANELVGDAIHALNMDWTLSAPGTPHGANGTKKKATSNKKPTPKPEPAARRATRLSGTPVPNAVTSALLSMGKRGRKKAEQGVSRISRELRRLQDTKEFAHVDDRPIIETVWSNGKFVDPRTLNKPAAESRASKRVKTSHDTEADMDEKTVGAAAVADTPAVVALAEEVPQKKRIAKKWLEKGLYAGQETPQDMSVGLTAAEKKRLAQFPELATVGKVNKTLPPPMFNGLRLLLQGRDFKLPYDICNPLLPGHPKPPAYRTMTKNRFVGDAGAYWKKQPHLHDFQSKCVCKPEDGCAEDCQNRIMLYECDDTNCNAGKDRCTNRAFQTLQERTKQGGRYRIGVEVFKTEGKGYGVRSNRCFRPHQIIMEYTGEIITEEECERRMNEIYKDNECYYLMSFDQNMIIDATTGSIARFVNHSCSPNCRMIKWIVGGQPRMALFAGDRPIMTGEELTYDYNFDPFSAKNVQKCLCGADNCRGVLGPKPREVKAPKAAAPSKDEASKKAGAKAGKRKHKELQDDDDDVYDVEKASAKSAKKRKIAMATGAASSLSKSGLKAAKGAATALKRSMSTISVSARAALTSKTQHSPQRRTSAGGSAVVKSKASKASLGKASSAASAKITTTKAAMATLSSLGLPVKKPSDAAVAVAQASRSSSASLTIVAAPAGAFRPSDGNAKPKPKSAAAAKRTTAGSPSSNSKPGKARRHSGYTPPSSPKAKGGAKPSSASARKKVPARKVLEGRAAGIAAVTKPKAKSNKSNKIAATAGKGFMAAVKKAVRSAAATVVTAATSSATPTPVAESPAAEASIEAVPARFIPALAPVSPLREPSPERETREAIDVQPRVVPQIRLVEDADA